MEQKNLDELSDLLTDEHLRQRIHPQPGDSLYLHLSDLLLALKRYGTEAELDILDFGAGISPYRSLFPNARYKRADFAIGTGEGLDFVLDESLQVTAPDNSFDMILSTQVLEHVEEPESYLRECLRLLRPGGKLVLTTHGIYADHPCPLDLHRWTSDGLAALCRKAGFASISTEKLTTGPRAILFLYDTHGRSIHRREASIFSALYALYYRFHCFFRCSIHRWADRFFAASRLVDQSGANDIYITVLVQATKPQP